MIDTTTKGGIGELVVAIDLLKKGWTVFFPIVDNTGCDLIAMKDNVIKTIQVKFHTKPSSGSSGSISIDMRKRTGRKNIISCKCNVVAVPLQKKELGIDTVVYIPYNGEITLSIAFKDAKNNQTSKRRWYKDFLDVPI
tara:strand:+ start:724 stop:1137 length:414 start_codon:yes stop_codon:yes gene_type:complete